jgi:hypothetical protein
LVKEVAPVTLLPLSERRVLDPMVREPVEDRARGEVRVNETFGSLPAASEAISRSERARV